MLEMMRWTFACSVSLLTLGCGGSEPQPASPASSDPAPAAAAPAASAAPAAAKSGGDGWEGEGEAKSGTAPARAATEATPAPAAGSGKEETRTIEVIQKIIKEHRPEVRDCYDKARKDLPSLQGDMVIHIVLDPEGKVKAAELNQERSTLKSPAVVDCALPVLKRIKFPPSSRGMESQVNYPFNLMPGGPPAR
jgi:protein TonB